MKRDAEVLVIGGGPVGLFAAVSLLERGVSVRVLDAADVRIVRGYACGLHPETLRALDRLSIMPAVLDTAHRIDRFSVRGGAAPRAVVEFSDLDGGVPYALALRQSELEEVLEDALQRRDGGLSRHHSVTKISLRDGCVRVGADVGEKAHSASWRAEPIPGSVTFEADYVIGADGHYSTCRHALGIEALPVRATKAFAVCDFQADLHDWEREACVALSAGTVSGFWPLGPNLGRWTFEIGENLHQELSVEAVRELLRERAPWFTPQPEQLCWGAVSSFEHRLAHSFGAGRVWLAGDAAHSTSPIGFQSMNRGMCEAEALSTLISSALHGHGHRPGLFEPFEREQRLEWQRLFGQCTSGRTTLWAGPEIAPCLPASGKDFDELVAELASSAARDES